jgi:hypothetical protein
VKKFPSRPFIEVRFVRRLNRKIQSSDASAKLRVSTFRTLEQAAFRLLSGKSSVIGGAMVTVDLRR